MANSAKNDDGISAREAANPLPAAVVVNAFKDDPSGLIPTRYLYEPIAVVLDQIWAAPAGEWETDYVHFVIQPHTPEPSYDLPVIPLVGPVTEADFPVQLDIGGNWLRISGSYDLTYYIDGPGGVEWSPFKTTFTLDWHAPGGTDPMLAATFPDEVNKFGITEAYLEKHADVDVTISSYLDRQPFDEVLCFLLDSSSDNPNDAIYTHTFVSATEPLIVPVPGHVFRELHNGERGFRYTLRDRAGNQRMDFSRYAEVLIDLEASPTGLKPPYVAAYAYDNLIDRQDAREGVTVRIDAYFDWKSTDEVSVRWNGIELGRLTVDTLPKFVPIDWDTLISKGYLQTRFPVQYFIYRAGSPRGIPSPGIRVDADFRVAGQDHENAPALYNQHLAKVDIFGAVSNTPNHLDFLDWGEPVTARVTLFDDPKVGQRMYLYWGAEEDPVASYLVKFGDVAGESVEFTEILWEVVERTPNQSDFPVRYRTSNGVNEQLSPVQSVNINIVKPVTFPRPDMADATPGGSLNCKTIPALWHGVRVRVNAHASILLNDEIRLKWQGTEGFAGDRPIKETCKLFTDEVWTDADAMQGYHEFVVPYAVHVQPMKDNAGAYAEFNVWRKGGRVGASTIRYVKIDRGISSTPPTFCGPDGNGPD